MFRTSLFRIVSTAAASALLGGTFAARALEKIDFGRDVQPIFQQKCYGCHGSTQQMNGFRLDRRRDAMRGGTIPVIGPGASEASRLYLRLIGKQYGPQMPPTGPLDSEQIRIIRAWIDQGAEWPDDLSGDTASSPADPRATRLIDALHRSDRGTFKTAVLADPTACKLRSVGGSTPLMYAVLYGDVDDVRVLLEQGADPNIRNDAGATALMWATDDYEKMKLLLHHGADPNVVSDAGRTALVDAAGRFGAAPVVKLLLAHGVRPSLKATRFNRDSTPLIEAAATGDAAVIGQLLEAGADVAASGSVALAFALRADCESCVDLLLRQLDRKAIGLATLTAVPPIGDATTLHQLLQFGADANTTDALGRTVLMRAAASDAVPLDIIKDLIDRGADVNVSGPGGETALAFARERGATPIVDLLLKAGAHDTVSPAAHADVPAAVPAASPRAAVERSLPILQRTDVAFSRKSGCVSCHHNSLTAITVAAARRNGLPVDDGIAQQQLKTIGAYIEGWRERVLQGMDIPGASDTVSYILVGLAAESYPPDEATDALARFIKKQQAPEGQWRITAHRPPIESSEIELAAMSMRSLQVYAPKYDRESYDAAIDRAAMWLLHARPVTTEDRAFQLLGLSWSKADGRVVQAAGRALTAEQRRDGGWAQLPSLASDSYATGQALVALNESGAVTAADPVFKRGVQFLLQTQRPDGTWYVPTRAIPIQPHFETGFPYGRDQFISAAATNWATRALIPAVARSRSY